MLTKQEIAVLQELAKQYAEIASLPIQKEKRNMWLKLNTIQMERPMVLIDQIPWHEMDVDGFLKTKVSDPHWRGIEWEMRTAIYRWHHMPADLVVNPYICLPRIAENVGWNLPFHAESEVGQYGGQAQTHIFVNQLQEMEDIEKIQPRKIIVHKEREAEMLLEAKEVFGGIIDYRWGGFSSHLGFWDFISLWMGVTNCYIELMDRPEFMHAIMERMTQIHLEEIRQMNELQLYDINTNICHCSQTFLPDLPKEGDIAVSGNAWAFGLAQLFTSVSPAITDEFEVAYMKRIFPYYGAIYYGCCDRLDDRLDIIAKLPKIRKISCSPWSIPEPFAEKMPDYCAMSVKPNPAFLAGESLDEDSIRKEIRRAIAAAKNYNRSVEFILKDITTVRNNPQRLWRWQEIAMEEVQR